MAEQTDTLTETQLVVFDLAGEYYGVDIGDVREIIRMQTVTKVPGAPSFVEGVINLRGEVLPVIDLRKRLNIRVSEQTNESRIVWLTINGQDDVGMVKRVKFDQVVVTHLDCNIHTEMSGFIIACQNPFFTMTDKKGNFEIPDVPAGTWKLTFFHEKIKTVTIDVTVDAGKKADVEFTGLKRKR